MRDATPSTRLIEALRAERVRYEILVAEALDNAVDAAARRIDVVMEGDEIIISDDGQGITPDRIDAAFILGQHGEMPNTKIGVYGVGIKWQALNAGDVYKIKSTSKSGTFVATADWAKMKRTGSWAYDEPTWYDAHALRTGTEVTVSKLRVPLKTNHLKAVIKDMERRFRPGIRNGLKLTFNRADVPYLPDPEMTDVIEGEVWIGEKGARIKAGMLKNPARSEFSKVDLVFAHRVIDSKGIFAVNSFSGIDSMYARVDLLGTSWRLDRFKECVEDPDLAEIEELVHEKLMPLLEKCHGQQMNAEIEEMRAALNAMLPPEFQPARAPKNPDKERPLVDPPQPGRKRTQNGVTEISTGPGPARQRRKTLSRAIGIHFDNCCAEHGVGHFIPSKTGKDGRIVLAKDCAHIAMFMESRDKPIGRAALFDIAMCIFMEHVGRNDSPQFQLPHLDHPFGKRVWLNAEHQRLTSEAA